MTRKRILMIEDDEEMIALGELILEKQGFGVLSATNGPAGLEILAREPVDLVLLDVMMDEMDGWQVLEQIRAQASRKDLPVIMLTARHYLEDQDETERYAHLYNGYIVKPFVVRELIDQVNEALST